MQHAKVWWIIPLSLSYNRQRSRCLNSCRSTQSAVWNSYGLRTEGRPSMSWESMISISIFTAQRGYFPCRNPRRMTLSKTVHCQRISNGVHPDHAGVPPQLLGPISYCDNGISKGALWMSWTQWRVITASLTITYLLGA